jgi:hypothetical protein
MYMQAHLNSIIGPEQSSALGSIRTQPLAKIKHIFIVLVFPTKSVLKH